MLKKYKHILFLVIALVFLILVEYLTPKPIDWRFTFSKDDKIPYGNYLIFNRLVDIFPKNNLSINNLSFYESFHNRQIKNSNFIIITSEFSPDKPDITEIYRLVKNGNHFLISANNFVQSFLDSLKCDQVIYFENVNPLKTQTLAHIQFTNSKLDTSKQYIYAKDRIPFYFVFKDFTKTVSLANMENNQPIFAKIKYGEGYFYLNSSPSLLTNWYMLKDSSSTFISNVFSHLPSKNTIWDEYYKPYRSDYKSPLNLILTNPSLQTAYIILIISILVYFIFESKRKQRIIPVIRPLQNSTLDFVRTIGRLYFHNRDNRDLALKKFIYLSDYVRQHYYLDIHEQSEELINKFAQKASVDKELINKIFEEYNLVNSKKQISDKDLLKYNSILETFYTNCK